MVSALETERRSTVPGVETLLLPKSSILDTPFVSSRTRRPLYTTHTDSCTTILFRVLDNSEFAEVGRILWTGYGSLAAPAGQASRSTCVLRKNANNTDTPPLPAQTWFVKSKNPFSNSRTFTPLQALSSNVACRWQATGGVTEFLPVYPENVLVWSCTLVPSSPQIALCYFLPPQAGTMRSEITVLDAGRPYLDDIVLSCILLCAKKDEYKVVQSDGIGPSLSLRSTSAGVSSRRVRGEGSQYSGQQAGRRRQPGPGAITPFELPPMQTRPARTSTVSSSETASPLYGSWFATEGAPPPYTSTADVSAAPSSSLSS